MKDSGQLQEGVIMPVGGIIIWSGDPTVNFDSTGKGTGPMLGWAICNGQNSTPDLSEKFIIGVGADYSHGSTGGSSTVSLTEQNLPQHSHSMNHSHTITDPQHSHNNNKSLRFTQLSSSGSGTGVWATNDNTTNDVDLTTTNPTGITGTNDYTGQTGAVGSRTAIPNIPPYYAVTYIMKVS